MTLCWCVFGCHVMQKGKVVCSNISGGSWDLPQFVFIYKLFSLKAKHCLSLSAVNLHPTRWSWTEKIGLITTWFVQICCTRHWIFRLLYERTASWSKQQIQQSMWMWNTLTVQWTEWGGGPYSWHNIISMSLLENNSICKDGGGIHYQQLGWNDNTHYTAISLHKAANGSNHSTLINKTLSFVSTWRASSIFHWDSHSLARQHGSNSLTAGEQYQSLCLVSPLLAVMQK